jgi:hypothetical protein
MVHLSLGVDMLAWAYCYRIRRGDVDQWRLARVGVWHPYGHGEAVGIASEIDGEGARQMQ